MASLFCFALFWTLKTADKIVQTKIKKKKEGKVDS